MNLQHGEEWRSAIQRIEDAVLYCREENPDLTGDDAMDLGVPDTVLSPEGMSAIRREIVRAGRKWARSVYGAQVFRELWEFRDAIRKKDERMKALEAERKELVCRAVIFGRLANLDVSGCARVMAALDASITQFDFEASCAFTEYFRARRNEAQKAGKEKVVK